MTAIPLYLGLGTNLGDRRRNLLTALDRLDTEFGCHWTKLSDFIETEPWGFESQDKFLNAAVRYDVGIPFQPTCSTKSDKVVDFTMGTAQHYGSLSTANVLNGHETGRLFDGDETSALTKAAHRILKICKRIELEMGRNEVPEYDSDGRRIYRSRIIDIDILLLGDLRLDGPDLKIPHPQIAKRPFVLVPLRQIAPELTDKTLI